MELEGDLNSVQVCLVGSLKRFGLVRFKDNVEIFKYLEVDHMSLGLGSADIDVKCVYLGGKEITTPQQSDVGFRTHNGLTEVFAHGRVSKRGEVDSVEVLLVPEVHLSHIGSDDEGHVENVDQEYKDTCRCQTLQSW